MCTLKSYNREAIFIYFVFHRIEFMFLNDFLIQYSKKNIYIYRYILAELRGSKYVLPVNGLHTCHEYIICRLDFF